MWKTTLDNLHQRTLSTHIAMIQHIDACLQLVDLIKQGCLVTMQHYGSRNEYIAYNIIK